MLEAEIFLVLLKFGLDVSGLMLALSKCLYASIGQNWSECRAVGGYGFHHRHLSVVASFKLIARMPVREPGFIESGAGANIGRFGSSRVPFPIIGTTQ